MVASLVDKLIKRLDARKVDLPTFDSNPMHYHLFMRAFKENVVRSIDSDATRLALLIQ